MIFADGLREELMKILYAQRKICRKLLKMSIILALRYVINPLSYSISGIRFMRHERPFRVELVCGIVVLPVCFWFFGWSWKLWLLVLNFFVLLIAECLNTAIESVVNLSAQNKKLPLAKKAKDTASAAVYIALWNIAIFGIFMLTLR
ncbi:MAG: diacylglycerol kinase [Puniceicoccales bacterium]|nr:diacylglycerol kinase [Puniceicoccales bacterium]